MTPTTEVEKAQATLIQSIWMCIVDASSMNVVLSGTEVNAAIRAFRTAIEAETTQRMRGRNLITILTDPEFRATLTVGIGNVLDDMHESLGTTCGCFDDHGNIAGRIVARLAKGNDHET